MRKNRKTKFQKMHESIFSRAAKMMSLELRANRAYYECHKPRRYKRTCEYCMHVQYNEIIVEITELMNR